MALTHLPRWNAGHRRVGSHRIYDHAACADLGADADFDVAEDLGSRADQGAAPHLRVPVPRWGLSLRPPDEDVRNPRAVHQLSAWLLDKSWNAGLAVLEPAEG